ncbi:PilX N-terminal domain-containing pilus assembly protein [Crenobacter caeni]|uniref:Type 4 fimbrial biogenesis protein PilX N-terminal domain-containing protein n=1 Tax=Crenobacter caeni TaxID=2705474 RepID=A0A6B2KT25_9NEIS|nr:PilX N-terminal domain-containing pilus assembly protein [Crenobacter caeni]NDV13117.1 hypothetical protein [Crenobacter caeni]
MSKPPIRARGSVLFLTLILLLALTVVAVSSGFLASVSEKVARAERERQFALGSAEHALVQIRALGLAQVMLLEREGALPDCGLLLAGKTPLWAPVKGAKEDPERNWAWTGLSEAPTGGLAGICRWTGKGHWQDGQLQAPDRLVYDCSGDNCRRGGATVSNLYRALDGGDERAGEMRLVGGGMVDGSGRQQSLSARYFIEVFEVAGCGDLPAFRVTARGSGEGGSDAPARARRTVEAVYLIDDLHGGCTASITEGTTP